MTHIPPLDRKDFSRRLIRWYRRCGRDLPWRRTRDPYKIWISEVMLQQTTVQAVIPYYEEWICQYPDILSVARASPEEILRSWQGLGYYQRARNIHQAARLICERHNGELPKTETLLRQLPGFGPYTTGAVLSIAFDRPWPVVDANIRRIVMRMLCLTEPDNSDTRDQIDDFLSQVLPARTAGTFNQALMDLGAMICRSRQPLCLQCPVRGYCRAHEKGLQEIIPPPRQKIIETVHAVIAVISRQHKYFLQQRPSHGLLADLWEFPGGKILPGESPRQALSREIREELGVEIQAARHLMDTRHFYTRYRVELSVWSCTVTGRLSADEHHRWVPYSRLRDFAMPSGSVRIVERLSPR